jgi:hypothetical protein
MSSITLEQCLMMPNQSSPLSSANMPPSRGNQSSSSLSPFIDDEMTFCTLLEEYQEQAFLYASAITDMIDIKDGTNTRCWSSSSFRHKECPSGHSVGAGQLLVPRDDDCKDIDFGFNSESDFCLACQ